MFLVNSYKVNEIESVCLSTCLNKNLLDKLIKSPITDIRHTAARCLKTICKQELVKTMNLKFEFTFDSLEMNEFVITTRCPRIRLLFARQVETVDHTVHEIFYSINEIAKYTSINSLIQFSKFWSILSVLLVKIKVS